MLLELAHWLAGDYRGFNVFNYITLRAVLATITALGISFVFGPAMIRWLTAKKIGQSVRTDGPQTHLVKMGTPTMGGALIHLAMGGFIEPFCLGGADRHLRFWRGGLGR
jgi:phospho-N-acetylmuramoyl-pentapeptide-transferase